MGSRMAANLQKAGHELIVYNRSAEKAEALVAGGATLANSPVEVGATCEIIITMLSTPDVVKATAQEFLPQMKPGSIWVDVSTVNPSFSREMAELAKKHEVRFIDAPVAGSKAPAEAGELLFLAGGKEEDWQEIKPYLDVMGKKTLFLAQTGNGWMTFKDHRWSK